MRFLICKKLEQLGFILEKISGIQKHAGKVRKCRFFLLFQCSEDAWDKIFDTNVKSSFLLAKSVVPHMEAQGAGSIVFISSIGGFHPIPVSDFLNYFKDYYIDGQNTQLIFFFQISTREKGPQITPRWWIFWTMIFYNLQNFTSRCI